MYYVESGSFIILLSRARRLKSTIQLNAKNASHTSCSLKQATLIYILVLFVRQLYLRKLFFSYVIPKLVYS